MKIPFSINHQYDDLYRVTYAIPLPGGKNLDASSNIRCDSFLLREVLNRAKKTIYSRLYAMRSSGQPVPPANNVCLEWDADTTNMPEKFHSQALAAQRRFSAPAELITAEPKELPLLEVVERQGVWTIQVHDKPLLTWAEACELLKEKVA